MIEIHKSETADTRTCDVSKVTKEQLIASTRSHIRDVGKALLFFQNMIMLSAVAHDYTKLSEIDQFFSDFKTGFKEHTWWENHQKQERHHIGTEVGVREDVDLVDVLEFISDCVMAGMARSGSVYELNLPDALLQKAFRNTVEKLKREVVVVEPRHD